MAANPDDKKTLDKQSLPATKPTRPKVEDGMLEATSQAEKKQPGLVKRATMTPPKLPDLKDSIADMIELAEVPVGGVREPVQLAEHRGPTAVDEQTKRELERRQADKFSKEIMSALNKTVPKERGRLTVGRHRGEDREVDCNDIPTSRRRGP